MKAISWCKKRTKGIKLIQPNNNLSEEYYKNAEESLMVLRAIKETQSKVWLATTKYYLQYFAAYAIFMKLGIKCEIHDCTITLLKLIENDLKISGFSKMLNDSKGLRIDNQYYLKNRPVAINLDELSDFLIATNSCLRQLHPEMINNVREKVKKLK